MDNYRLLEGGREAFLEIINCIRNAEKSIEIHMFIWRDDRIGNRLAKEVADAADRGVKITIVKDRYGSVCEYSEEGGRSFFHYEPVLPDLIKANALKLGYHPEMLKKRCRQEMPDRFWRLFSHPNVTIRRDQLLKDHSKFYVIDEKILILGGINVEDKEIGKDMRGMAYLDYMIAFYSEDIVSRFRDFYKDVQNKDPLFARNDATAGYFGIKERMLELIDQAERELLIVMPYFSMYKEVAKAIEKADERGVSITVVLPKAANFYDDTNKQTMNDWRRRTGALQILFSDRMVHAKVMMSEKEITVGSCNLNRRSLDSLGELNVFLPADAAAFPGGDPDGTYAAFLDDLKSRIQKIVTEAAPATEAGLMFSRKKAGFESFSYYAENLFKGRGGNMTRGKMYK